MRWGGAARMRRKVALAEPIHEAGLRLLESTYEVILATDPAVDTMRRIMPGVSGVIVRTAPFTREILEAADCLKVIARHGVGVDNIDVRAATERGIVVATTPGANASSVAEHVMMFMLVLARRSIVYDRATRQGMFDIRNSFQTVDLAGKTLGIVGVGRIGSLLARKCRAALDMRVIGYDPFLAKEKAREMGVELRDSLDEVLSEADVVSLHLPLTPDTRGLIGRKQLDLMRPSAILINTARGGIVDEDALYEVLRDHRIAGAAIDVFGKEPPDPDNPLLSLDNVVLSPHCAALTLECAQRMAMGAARAVIDVLEGRRPEGVVNPEVYARR